MANSGYIEDLMIEDARIIFRNFAGAAKQFNEEGKRNFNLVIPPEAADGMERAGWNIKYLKAREEGDAPQPILKVNVSYKHRPPTVVLITSKGRTNLGEDDIDILDWQEIKQVDVRVSPSKWDMNGRSGVSAYLRSIYVTIQEDYLEQKYMDVPELGAAEAQLALESGQDVWGEPLEDLGEFEQQAIEA